MTSHRRHFDVMWPLGKDILVKRTQVNNYVMFHRISNVRKMRCVHCLIGQRLLNGQRRRDYAVTAEPR